MQTVRCEKCDAKWSLVCTLGPGGDASPGQYFVIVIVLICLALISYFFWYALFSLAMAIVATILLIMCLCGCGFREPHTGYKGCECPQCGHKNFIYPWHF